MKERKWRMIKIAAAAAVATCMYTCMSGHRRSLAALYTRVSNKAMGLTCAYLLKPFAVNKCAALLQQHPHQKVQRKSNCCRESPFFFFLSSLCSLMACCFISSDELEFSPQPITLIKLSAYVNVPSNFRQDVKIKPVFLFHCIITLNVRNKNDFISG